MERGLLKQQLFNLTSYIVRQNGKRYRMISAVGRMAESFARVLSQDTDILVFFDLPVKTKAERGAATKFRNFLLMDGVPKEISIKKQPKNIRS